MLRRSPRGSRSGAPRLVVAVVTAVVVGRDLAALHRRAADLGPGSTRSSPPATCPVGHHAHRRPTSTARTVHRSQLPAARRDRSAALVVGRVVAVPVVAGAYVVTGNLAPRRRTGLDGVVPRGMRAMRIVVTDALRPRPGAAVDVLASFDPGGRRRA